jgi:hypothetical protein
MHWDLPAWLAGWLLIVPPIDLPWPAVSATVGSATQGCHVGPYMLPQ